MMDPRRNHMDALIGLGFCVLLNLTACSSHHSVINPQKLWRPSAKEKERTQTLPALRLPEEFQDSWTHDESYDIPHLDSALPQKPIISDEPPEMPVGDTADE